MEQIVCSVLTESAGLGDVALQNIAYLLGLGIFSVSYSILVLMEANRVLGLPITIFSVFAGYMADTCLDVNFFLVLFGTALAVSTFGGWLVGRRDNHKKTSYFISE